MRNLRFIFIVLLFAGVALLSALVFKKETDVRVLKEDLIELSKVKYGLFSVDEWKSIIETVITKKIEEFNFNELPKAEIRNRIQEMLYKVTGNLKDSFKEDKGFLPKAVANITGIFDKMEDDVPQITETIIAFVEDPNNREAVKLFALKKVDEMTDKTFSDIDYTTYDAVIEKYDCQERDVVIAQIQSAIADNEAKSRPLKFALFSLAAVAALALLFAKNLTKHEFFVITILTVCFLVTGLLLPMIEIDARVSEMNFSLLGEPIHFEDQILYYKNKSILEVVQVMIVEERFDLMIVGFLVLLFSVLFPLAKLISSVFYVYSKKIRQSGFVKFLIFRTGKWSMADVMVIAIFMAFIGFSGILREQLQQIEIHSENLDLLTTNASRLQVGFFTFLSFAILGLLVSHKLQYAFAADKKEVLEEQIEEVEEKKVKKHTRKPRARATKAKARAAKPRPSPKT